MRTWTRATSEVICGGCPRRIVAGAPMQEIRLPGVKHVLRRCEICGGGAPPDLPPRVITQVDSTALLQRVGAIAAAKMGRLL